MQPYLEGRLATLERNEFVHHVTECAACERDVIEYREVFRALRAVPRFEAPPRISVAVMAHLHAEGLVHEPRFPWARRQADRFMDLPARVRYPVAAMAAVTMLYLPVALVLGGARASLAGVAEGFARGVLWAQGAVSGTATLSMFEPYARAARTVAHATSTLVTPATLAVAALLFVAVVVSMSIVLRRKRSSSHAMFSL